jgi:hypothetical protein
MRRESYQSPTLSFLLTAALLPLVLVLVGCHSTAWEQARSTNSAKGYESFLKRYPESVHKAEAQQRLEDISWEQARSNESTWKYQQFLKQFPTSRHAEEAQTRLRVFEFESVLKSHASAKSKQEFIAKYAGTEEAAKVSKDLEGMAIVDLEYPKSITQTGGSSGNPVWNFCIVFHERNGVAARINCTSLGGRNLQQTWWHPSPIKGNIHLPAKGTRSYCSWVSGGSLRGSSTSVSFSIVDENGHSSSAWASFILE